MGSMNDGEKGEAASGDAGKGQRGEGKLGLDKNGDFTAWYGEVLAYTKFVDDRFPLKGAVVWRPFGFKALKLMFAKLDSILESGGCSETYFPLLSPAKLFGKERDFLEGMKTESLRVTHYGENRLAEEFVVRPTSETIMYPMFSKWVRSKSDLPVRVYQTAPVFRWETKMTSPMLRAREVVKFNEVHTVHSDREGMEAQMQAGLRQYAEFFNWMLLPYIMVKTPSWDTFPGAEYNIDFYTVLPNGKAAELASVIALSQKFSKAYDITFTDENGEARHCWQTCYGLSERTLGAAIAVHGDNMGIRLPSRICPVQVVIIPIDGKTPLPGLPELVERVRVALGGEYRVEVDARKIRPGQKFYHWELHGVPVRIEIGASEVETGTVTVASRMRDQKTRAALADLPKAVADALARYDERLKTEAAAEFGKRVKKCATLDEAILHSDAGIVAIPWDGTRESADAMLARIPGTALGTLYPSQEVPPNLPDPVSNKNAVGYLHIAKTV